MIIVIKISYIKAKYIKHFESKFLLINGIQYAVYFYKITKIFAFFIHMKSYHAYLACRAHHSISIDINRLFDFHYGIIHQ